VTAPAGADLSLRQVASSAAAAIGVPDFTDDIGIGPCRSVVVLLIDGLGWNLLDSHRELAPTLVAMAGGPISAVFPTTTPVGLGSFGTGLLPGAHGLVGASFWLPESDEVLNPLHWGSDPYPVAVQPEPTVFEAVQRAGFSMATVSPEAYRTSGLTRAVLRGGSYLGADDAGARITQVRSFLAQSGPGFVYVYWFELDRIGHEFGVDSSQWRAALGRAESLVVGLLSELPPGTSLVVTADHGMVDCPAESRVSVDDHPELMSGVRHLTGDPRARHVYAERGAAHEVLLSWRAILGDDFTVLSRVEVEESGLLGEVDAALAGRIGDVLVISRGSRMIASSSDATVSQLIGQHGALTGDEVLIPALVHRTE